MIAGAIVALVGLDRLRSILPPTKLHAFAAIEYRDAMSNSEISTIRDAKTGRFQPGNSGGPGRPRGSRNLLGERYLADMRDVWETHGKAALIACAEQEPGRFCQLFASLLPRELDVRVAVDASDFATQFRTAQAMLGNPGPERPRRPLPNQPLMIEHDG